MRNRRIRVIIADDHPVVLDGMRSCLATELDIQVIGAVQSFTALLDLLDTIVADVVVLDLLGMGAGPITMVNRLQRDYPRLAIVIFSSVVDLAVDLLRMGVRGYIAKEDMSRQLVAAVLAASQGETVVSQEIANQLEWAKQAREGVQLSPREHQVLRLVAQGLRTEAIANQIGIDPRTVHNYMTILRRKTNCASRDELIDWYRRTVQHHASPDQP